jgi:hypothetical protein
MLKSSSILDDNQLASMDSLEALKQLLDKVEESMEKISFNILAQQDVEKEHAEGKEMINV